MVCAMRRLSLLVTACVLLLASSTLPFTRDLRAAQTRADLVWDAYGVAHIFAPDLPSMFEAHGRAQMAAQANLLLHLYGESRGRGAEYWGPSALALDRWVQLNGVPERAQQWYDQQTPLFRSYLDAFARGITAYGTAHPEEIAPANRVVLPVTGVDVIGHALRIVHYGYMATDARVQREARALRAGVPASSLITPLEQELASESNTWSIGPARSASGKAMLLINPHLNWGDTFYRYQEVHLVAPGIDLYGAPQVGFPVPVVGFNRHAGWSRTVNTIDTVDVYRLTLKDDGYVFDGAVRPFERATKVLKVKQPDGSFTEDTVSIRRSVHGPVVYDQNGVTLALRVAGIDRPKMLEQWFEMGKATTLSAFTAALKMMQVPMWNQNYADDQGHIMLVSVGLVPRRPARDTYTQWDGVIAGDTSATLWTDYLSFDELPKSIDPASGWNQNTNEPPWTMTVPQLDRTKYAPYSAPDGQTLPQMRTLRSLRMITEGPKLTYDDMVARIHSTRMELADRVLPDLLKAADAAGGTDASRLLAKWDHDTETTSRGAVLFQLFAEQYLTGNINAKLRVKYDPANPVGSAYGLADPAAALKALEAAAAECLKRYGALDVPWGDVYRFASGPGDVAGNGGSGNSGVFRTITFSRRDGNRFYAAHGETIVCVVEFAAQQKANCALSYGNSSQPGSPHLTDQLALISAKKLHPVLRERADIK